MMTHTIGLYVWTGSEEYERQQIRSMLNRMRISQPVQWKLMRYKAKLAQLFSEGVYDHMKALDLIYYAVIFQRHLTPREIQPSLYTCWNVTRLIVRDLEEGFFQIPKQEIRRFWQLEQEEEDRVFEKWWEFHKKELTDRLQRWYNER